MKYALFDNKGPFDRGFLGQEFLFLPGENQVPRNIYNALVNGKLGGDKVRDEHGKIITKSENPFVSQLKTARFRVVLAKSTPDMVVVENFQGTAMGPFRGYEVVLHAGADDTPITEDQFQRILSHQQDNPRMGAFCFGCVEDGVHKNADGEIEFEGWVDDDGKPTTAPDWFVELKNSHPDNQG